ncbi:hypothetical protein C8R43DRAFT_1020061 [Mycena crocata]|nr:hypothetical protein C8R43DRAFT_1020061 [Mycena crocata]
MTSAASSRRVSTSLFVEAYTFLKWQRTNPSLSFFAHLPADSTPSKKPIMSDDAASHSLPGSVSSSRSASPEPERVQQPRPASSRRREKGAQRQQQQQPQYQQQPQNQQLQQQQKGGQQEMLGQMAPQAGQLLGDTLGQVTGGGGGQKKEALKLRLDLNLEVDVQIKARVHGDVTLSLLN